jgi:large subunit ribosomal protein L16
MLMPKKQKFRKVFRARSKFTGKAKGGDRLSFGAYGLKAVTTSEVTSRQIEAARRAMTRYIKRGGKVWIRIFPHTPITKKAAEVPMGSGKGTVDHYVSTVKPGTIIFEMDGVEESIAREAMRLASHKLPLKTKFINQEIH